MRILQVVTYASVDGAFGGPLAVAVAQSVELARLGHEVELIAGWDGRAIIEAPGVRLRLFPVRRILPSGFSGLWSWRLQKFVAASAGAFDVVHVHLGRDLITAPVAWRAVRLHMTTVLQTHGMVMPDARIQSRIFDSIWTKPLLRKAHAVLHLTEDERLGLTQLVGPLRSLPISNGVPVPNEASDSNRYNPDVLFLARLHPRKRVLDFAKAALLLSEKYPAARFSIVGPDEGELKQLEQFIVDHGLHEQVIYEGTLPPGSSLKRFARSSIYVLPSVGEVFPMSLLEAMSVGTPCVITDDNGLASAIEEANAGIVTNANPASLASAIGDLLSNDERRRAAGQAARALVTNAYSAAAVARRLESIYNGMDR